MNFDEFKMSMHISKQPPESAATPENKGRGRPQNQSFELHAPHPLAGEYEIKQKSKFDVPILVGMPPPRRPPGYLPDKSTTPLQRRKVEEHAKYFCTLFMPWSYRARIVPSPETWEDFLDTLQRAAAYDPSRNDDGGQLAADITHTKRKPRGADEEEKEAQKQESEQLAADITHKKRNPLGADEEEKEAQEREKHQNAKDIARGRLFRIECVANALVTRSKKTTITAAWRSRDRTLWSPADVASAGSKPTSATRSDTSADQEIDALRAAASRSTNPQLLRRAASIESWTEKNFESLKHLQTGSLLAPDWPAGAPPRAGDQTLPQPREPGGLPKVLENIAKPRARHAPSPTVARTPARASNGPNSGEEDIPPDFHIIDQETFRAEVAAWCTLCKSLPAGATKPPPPLNPEQRSFARDHLALSRQVAHGRLRGESQLATFETLQRLGLRPIRLLQGAGGVGKSVLLSAMDRNYRRLGLGAMVVTAWTGVASAPFGSPTLCSLLNISYTKLGEKLTPTAEQLELWRAEFEAAACNPNDLLVFTIDEVSLLLPEALHQVDMMLRYLRDLPDVPFGGVAIILAGDFWQKAPPGNTGSLAEILAGADIPGLAPRTTLDPLSNRAKGLEIFRQARRTVLTQQMRAADDPVFQEQLLHLRDTGAAAPVPASLLDALQEISREDVATDPAWAWATVAVLSNHERHHLNRSQAEAFARAHRLPLVRWKLPLTGRAAELLDGKTADDVYDHEPGLWGTFVRGAPAMLTENIQSTKYLANGASGHLHSLTFQAPPPADVAAALARHEFTDIVLDEPPLCVNFQLTLPDDDDGAGIDSLVGDAIVVLLRSPFCFLTVPRARPLNSQVS